MIRSFGEGIAVVLQSFIAIFILVLLVIIIIAASVVTLPFSVMLRTVRDKVEDACWLARESWKLMVSDLSGAPRARDEICRPPS